LPGNPKPSPDKNGGRFQTTKLSRALGRRDWGRAAAKRGGRLPNNQTGRARLGGTGGSRKSPHPPPSPAAGGALRGETVPAPECGARDPPPGFPGPSKRSAAPGVFRPRPKTWPLGPLAPSFLSVPSGFPPTVPERGRTPETPPPNQKTKRYKTQSLRKCWPRRPLRSMSRPAPGPPRRTVGPLGGGNRNIGATPRAPPPERGRVANPGCVTPSPRKPHGPNGAPRSPRGPPCPARSGEFFRLRCPAPAHDVGAAPETPLAPKSAVFHPNWTFTLRGHVICFFHHPWTREKRIDPGSPPRRTSPPRWWPGPPAPPR